MKGVKNILSVFAAIMTGMTGMAMAQDTPGTTDNISLDHAMRSYQSTSGTPTDRISWTFEMEPQLTVGNLRMTGLAVDCMTPHYASIMLNPPAAMRGIREVPPNLKPVVIPHPINDPAAHEPDFAVLRISF